MPRKPSASHWVQKLPPLLYRPSRDVFSCQGTNCQQEDFSLLWACPFKCIFAGWQRAFSRALNILPSAGLRIRDSLMV